MGLIFLIKYLLAWAYLWKGTVLVYSSWLLHDSLKYEIPLIESKLIPFSCFVGLFYALYFVKYLLKQDCCENILSVKKHLFLEL